LYFVARAYHCVVVIVFYFFIFCRKILKNHLLSNYIVQYT
jgi:hypothetical protein